MVSAFPVTSVSGNFGARSRHPGRSPGCEKATVRKRARPRRDIFLREKTVRERQIVAKRRRLRTGGADPSVRKGPERKRREEETTPMFAASNRITRLTRMRIRANLLDARQISRAERNRRGTETESSRRPGQHPGVSERERRQKPVFKRDEK